MTDENTAIVIFGFGVMAAVVLLIRYFISVAVKCAGWDTLRSTLIDIKINIRGEVKRGLGFFRMSPGEGVVVARASALRSNVQSQFFLLQDLQKVLSASDMDLYIRNLEGAVLVRVASQSRSLQGETLRERFRQYFDGVRRHHRHIDFIARSWEIDNKTLDRLSEIYAGGLPFLCALVFRWLIGPLVLLLTYLVTK